MDPWVYPPWPKVPSWIWIRCIYSATYRNTFMLLLLLCRQQHVILLRHSAISFLLTLWEIIILLSPTAIGLRLWLTTSSLSLFSNKTFAMTVAMQILHRHLVALFHLYSAYSFWRHLFLIPKFMGLRTTGWMANACSSLFNRFLPTMTTSTKATFQLKPLLNF